MQEALKSTHLEQPNFYQGDLGNQVAFGVFVVRYALQVAFELPRAVRVGLERRLVARAHALRSKGRGVDP